MTTFCSSGTMTSELCPKPGDVISFHTQIMLNGVLEIPFYKPPAEDVLNAIHEINVTKFTTITVKKPPGMKVLVVGTFMFGVEYIAKVEDQKVHFAHWELPFQALIKNNDGSLLPLDFDIKNYIVHVCVEHLEFSEIDERTISKEIVLLIWLQPKDN